MKNNIPVYKEKIMKEVVTEKPKKYTDQEVDAIIQRKYARWKKHQDILLKKQERQYTQQINFLKETQDQNKLHQKERFVQNFMKEYAGDLNTEHHLYKAINELMLYIYEL